MKEFFKKYPFFPPFLVLATNLISSFLTRPFISGRVTDIVSVWDKRIPFIPEFIYIYVLAFVQWTVCFIATVFCDKDKSRYFCFGASVANLLSGIVFLVFPTVMSIRPQFEGGGALTEFIGKFIFAADTPPMNILPSLHCLHSWICLRMIFSLKRVRVGIKVINAIFSVLVFLSVLFVKQHMIIDIPTGIIAAEAGLLIIRLCDINKRHIKP